MEPGEIYIADFLRQVIKAIGYVIASDCEPV
jgi:hypothetical protein